MTSQVKNCDVIEELRALVDALGASITYQFKISSLYDRGNRLDEKRYHQGIAKGYLESSRLIDALIKKLKYKESHDFKTTDIPGGN